MVNLGCWAVPRYRHSMSTWAEPEVWYAQLPSFHAAAAGLITATGTDHVLLVKPSYRDGWSLPGGYVEAAEFPSRRLRPRAARGTRSHRQTRRPAGRGLGPAGR